MVFPTRALHGFKGNASIVLEAEHRVSDHRLGDHQIRQDPDKANQWISDGSQWAYPEGGQQTFPQTERRESILEQNSFTNLPQRRGNHKHFGLLAQINATAFAHPKKVFIFGTDSPGQRPERTQHRFRKVKSGSALVVTLSP